MSFVTLVLLTFYIERVSPANMVVHKIKWAALWRLHCCVLRNSVPVGHKVADLGLRGLECGLATPISWAPPWQVGMASPFLELSTPHPIPPTPAPCLCFFRRVARDCVAVMPADPRAPVSPEPCVASGSGAELRCGPRPWPGGPAQLGRPALQGACAPLDFLILLLLLEEVSSTANCGLRCSWAGPFNSFTD